MLEQLVQISLDGGATWIDSDSFSGQGWFAADGSPSESCFNTDLQAGALVRNCLRVVGDTQVFYDTKTIPDPQIVRSPTSIVFSNNAVDTNDCYDVASDIYGMTLRLYDTGVLVEEHIVPDYTPSTSQPDLTGMPAGLASLVSNGPDGYEVALFPGAPSLEVHAVLRVTHDYVCDDPTLNTTISWSVDSYGCRVLPSAIVDGTTIKIDITDTVGVADPNNYVVDILDSSGVNVISFANPQVAGTFPADALPPGATFPLPEGTYHPVIDGDICAPFKVEEWNLCTNPVQINYNGLVSESGKTHLLPIDPGATALDSALLTYNVSDQIVVRDCTNAIMYDSGQIATGSAPALNQIDLTLFDISCGILSVEMVPNPAAPPTEATIYSVSVGCCEVSGLCELPKRRLFVGSQNADSCYSKWSFYEPYQAFVNNVPTNNEFRVNLKQLEGPSCLVSDAKTSFSYGYRAVFTGAGVCYNGDLSCLDFGRREFRTVTKVGNKIQMDFTDAAAYTMAKGFFDTVNAKVDEINTDPDCQSQFLRYIQRYNVLPQDALCAQDGNDVINTGNLFLWNSTIVQFDPGNNRICLDYDLFDFTVATGSQDPCLLQEVPTETPQESCQNSFTFFDSNMASVPQMVVTGGAEYKNVGPGGLPQEDGDYYVYTFDWGIERAPCAHNSPVEQYTFRYHKTNWSDWTLSDSNGVFQQNAMMGAFPVEDHDYTPMFDNNYHDSLTDTYRKWIAIENTDGFPLEFVDYGACTFDMTYYGGGPAEVFADDVALAARFTLLTNQSWTEDPNGFNVFSTDVAPGGLQNITCTI